MATQVSETLNKQKLLMQAFGEPLSKKLFGKKIDPTEARSATFQQEIVDALAKQCLRGNPLDCFELYNVASNFYIALFSTHKFFIPQPEDFNAFKNFQDLLIQKVVFVKTPCETTPNTTFILTSQFGNGPHRLGLSPEEVDLLDENSDFFKNFFQNSKVGEVEVGGFFTHEIIELLNCLSAPLSIGSLEDLVKYSKIAERFQIPKLKHECLSYLDQFLTKRMVDTTFIDSLARLFRQLESLSPWGETEATRRVKNFLVSVQELPAFREALNDFYKAYLTVNGYPSDLMVEWLKSHTRLQPSALELERFSNWMSRLATFSELKTVQFKELTSIKHLKGFDFVEQLEISRSLYILPAEVFEALPNLRRLILNGKTFEKEV